MANIESVRRSGRSNKGKNSKLEQELRESEDLYKNLQKDQSSSTTTNGSKNSKQSGSKKRRNSNEDVVQCLVCGTTTENYNEDEDDRDMIQCDLCHTWQHNECILPNPKKIPKIYHCNACEPNNKYYLTLTYKIDPAPYIKSNTKRDDDEFNDADNDELVDDSKFSDDEDYNDHKSISNKRRPSIQKSNSSSSATKTQRKRVKSSPSSYVDDIDQKARLAVTKRFEGMFSKLLSNHKRSSPLSSESISTKWAKKLEEDLYDVYHDKETGKLTKDYKEASTRIFVNVKDEKNSKLRSSIINRTIPFNKLVVMTVNQLLNPELKKEKEEAIKESMTLATLEKNEVSNIRRTHKGDIVIENEDGISNNQQFDFNVGINLDNDEEKFINSKSVVSNERKNSLYNHDTLGDDFEDNEYKIGDEDNDVNDNNNDNYSNSDNNSNNNNELNDINENAIHHSRIDQHSKSTTPLLDDAKEDEDLAFILGETKKKIEQNIEISISKNPSIWSGQTIFTGFTNFESSLKLIDSTLNNKDTDVFLKNVIDESYTLIIEGRLDSNKGDDYINKVSNTRKLILLELQSKDVTNDKNYVKLYDYFKSKGKYGVLPNSSYNNIIKDCYILPIDSKLPNFLNRFPHSSDINKYIEEEKVNNTGKLFIVFIIKQELIKDLQKIATTTIQAEEEEYDPTTQTYGTNDNGIEQQEQPSYLGSNFQFLNNLDPDQLALVNKIFDQNPQTKLDPNLLIQYLQAALTSQLSK